MNKKVSLCAVAIALAATAAFYGCSRGGAGDEPRQLRISCVNNLRQIGLCLRIWGGDHNYQFPWNVGTNGGGSKEFCDLDKDGFDKNSWRHFQAMSNELGSPLCLVCPSDKQTKPVENFANLTASNVSYRIHITPRLVLGSGKKTPLVVCKADGSILFCDGSVKSGNPNEPNEEPVMVPVPGGREFVTHTNVPVSNPKK